MMRLTATALFAISLTAAIPVRAQMGTSSNPPPQHLFNTDQPTRLNTGTGTMAERRQQLAKVKRGRVIHR